MCSTPKMPTVKSSTAPTIAAPTYADAAVQKAGANTRRQGAALFNENIRTSALGLADDAATKKTKLGE